MNQQVFESCFASLKGLLEKLCLSSDEKSREIAGQAVLFLDELGKLARTANVAREAPIKPQTTDSDPSNYALYELLASYGLSQQQLIEVARTEGLHELRVLRMPRMVYQLSLAEAQQVLAEAKN